MFKYLLIFIIFIFCHVDIFGQIPNYSQLIDSSTKYAGLFIGSHPLKNIRLDISDTAFYKEFLGEVSGYKIDIKILVELINNSRNTDTSYWTDTELKNAIVIKSRDEYINLKNAIIKFKLVEKEQIKIYRKKINAFNNTSSWDKNIFYFSRPAFDNSKQFAAVCYDDGHSGLGGGGSITLFHYSGTGWIEIGDITRWKH